MAAVSRRYNWQAFRSLVARLDGFLARKGDGEPGAKTIWLDMQRILDFAAGIMFSRESQGIFVQGHGLRK
jgi:hypothetical protein